MITKVMYKYYSKLNTNKLVLGLAMLTLNIGSKYVELNLSKSQEAYIRNSISRELLIFTILFVGTRDIITAILMTAAFTILANTIFNEKSKYCIMSDKFKRLESEIDTNHDNVISDKEIENARKILYKANMQKNNKFQLNDSNYFQANI